MLPYFLGGILTIIVPAVVLLTWMLWRDDKRESDFEIAKFIADISSRCDQLALTNSSEETRSSLKSLSHDLARKAAELQSEFDVVKPSVIPSLPMQVGHRISSLEASLMIVAECTVILLAIDYWAPLPPICMALAYFVPIVFVSTRYGLIPAFFALAASAVLAAFLFFPPRFSIYVADQQQRLELLAFFGIGLLTIQVIVRQMKKSAK